MEARGAVCRFSIPLFELERSRVQLVVGAALFDELFVRAALDDAAVVENHA